MKRTYKLKRENTLLSKHRSSIETAVIITILVLALISLHNLSDLTGFAVSDEIVGLPEPTQPSETIPANDGSEQIGLPQEPSSPSDSGASSGGDEVIGLPVGEASPPSNETFNETGEIVGFPEDEIVGAQADCGATTQSSVANGDWNNTATWSGACTIDSSTNVIVKHNITIVGTGFNASAVGIDAGGHLRLAVNETTNIKTTGNFTINAGGVFSGGVNNIWLTGVDSYGLLEATTGNLSVIEEGTNAVAWNNQPGSKFIHNNGMLIFDGGFSGGSTTIVFKGNASSNPANITITRDNIILTNAIINITGNLVMTSGHFATDTGLSGAIKPLNVTGLTIIGGNARLNGSGGISGNDKEDWSYFGAFNKFKYYSL